MIYKKKSLTILVIFIACSLLSSNSFERGEQLFIGNRPSEAIPYLQKSLLEENTNPLVYTYLGVAYMQIGQNDKALETFQSGLTVSGTRKKNLYFNAGNICFITGNYEKATEFYDFAIAADPLYSKAYLNRANSNLKLQNYQDSIDDYTQYIAIDVNSAQKENVQAMIAALQNEIALQKENEKKAAEALALQKEEEDRIAAKQQEEAAKQQQLAAEKEAAEKARRQKLLEEVASELQQTESTYLTAGSEGVLEYEDEESELD